MKTIMNHSHDGRLALENDQENRPHDSEKENRCKYFEKNLQNPIRISILAGKIYHLVEEEMKIEII